MWCVVHSMDQRISNTVVVDCNANATIIRYQNHHDSRDVSHHVITFTRNWRWKCPQDVSAKMNAGCTEIGNKVKMGSGLTLAKPPSPPGNNTRSILRMHQWLSAISKGEGIGWHNELESLMCKSSTGHVTACDPDHSREIR